MSAAAIALALVLLVGAGIAFQSWSHRNPREPKPEPTLDEKVRRYRRSKYRNPEQMSGMAGGLFGTGVWMSGGDGGFDGGGFDGGGDGGGS